MKLNKILTSILFSLAFAVSSSSMASGTHAGHESEKEKSQKTDCGKHAHEAGKKDEHAENGADKCAKSSKSDGNTVHSH